MEAAKARIKLGRPLRILLVEDNKADVWLLQEALRGAGVQFETTVLNDGEEALVYLTPFQKSAAARPDLMVLDLNLPKVDGTTVVDRIASSESLRDMPVVLLSSSDSERDRSRAGALGCATYLTKPSNLDGFLALGNEILSFWENCASKGTKET